MTPSPPPPPPASWVILEMRGLSKIRVTYFGNFGVPRRTIVFGAHIGVPLLETTMFLVEVLLLCQLQ